MRKSNVICPIYRRLGKCLAYANGRCHKVHDQRYVIVCPKFLTGSCQDEKCLLSHNANLHKMPVCKFFLQGLCHKQRDCLYLHKKLTDDTKLCADFLKGYCSLADKVKILTLIIESLLSLPEFFQCNLLHDFPQSEQRDKKKYSIVRHKLCKQSARKSEKPPAEANADNARYYIDDSTSTEQSNIPQRGKLGALPSYIPL